MMVSLIVAISADGVIGQAGNLPWHLPADLARFKRTTMGHAIVMGRKTYESIGRPLPGRTSVVVTRQRNYAAAAGVIVVSSLAEALGRIDDDEIFIIGGAEIYRWALPMVDRMYVTRVHVQVAGDVKFPDFDPAEWQLRSETRHEPDLRNKLPFTFQIFERATGSAGVCGQKPSTTTRSVSTLTPKPSSQL